MAALGQLSSCSPIP